VGEAGRGGERQLLVLRAQHAERAAQLAQRRPPRVLHGREGGTRLGGVAWGRSLGGVGLEDHGAQRARDDVVQLGRDPRPLLGHRGLATGRALPLRARRLLAQRTVESRAPAHEAAGEEGEAEEEAGHPQHVADPRALHRILEGDRRDHAGCRDAQGNQPAAAVEVRRRGVVEEQHTQVGAVQLVGDLAAEGLEQHEADVGDDERGQRQAAAQRQAAGDEQHHAQGGGPRGAADLQGGALDRELDRRRRGEERVGPAPGPPAHGRRGLAEPARARKE
jgi:hypothetical protein